VLGVTGTVYLIVSSLRYWYCAQCFVTASASDLHSIGSWIRFRIPNALAKQLPGIITVLITTYIVFAKFNRTKSNITLRVADLDDVEQDPTFENPRIRILKKTGSGSCCFQYFVPVLTFCKKFLLKKKLPTRLRLFGTYELKKLT
jgi:hypothetical protein